MSFNFFNISIFLNVCILMLKATLNLRLWATVTSLIIEIIISNLNMFYTKLFVNDKRKQIRALSFNFFNISIFLKVCILTLADSFHLRLVAIVSLLIVGILILNLDILYFKLSVNDKRKQIQALSLIFFNISIFLKVCILKLEASFHLRLWAIVSSVIVEILI